MREGRCMSLIYYEIVHKLLHGWTLQTNMYCHSAPKYFEHAEFHYGRRRQLLRRHQLPMLTGSVPKWTNRPIKTEIKLVVEMIMT